MNSLEQEPFTALDSQRPILIEDKNLLVYQREILQELKSEVRDQIMENIL